MEKPDYVNTPGIDATKKIACEGFKREGPPFIKIDESVSAKLNELFQRAR